MKLKLSHSEFTAMLQIFVAIVVPYSAYGMEAILEKALLMQVYEKLYRHAIHAQAKYSIKITVPEAIAFYTFWQRHQFKNPISFEANLVRTTNNLIHQKIAA